MLRPVPVEVNLWVIIPLSVLFPYPQQRQLCHASCLICNLATHYLSMSQSLVSVPTLKPNKNKEDTKKINLADITFGFRRTTFAELKNNTVWAHSFIFVTAKELVQAAEVSFGSTEVELPALRPGYLAVFEFYSAIHLQHTERTLEIFNVNDETRTVCHVKFI